MTVSSSPPTARRPTAERAVAPMAPNVDKVLVDKVAARRDELAAAALRTLAERGYANTSLREIAQHSDFSHGVLHYYFADKTHLLTHCVRLYKARCVRRYADIPALATSAADLVDRFVGALLLTLREDSHEQRVWYDMRVQSLFDGSFRDDVAAIDQSLSDMIWEILGHYARWYGGALRADQETAYALFDGVFAHAVRDWLNGADGVEAVLERRLRQLMDVLVLPADGPAT